MQLGQNVYSFLVAAVLGEPARRFGEDNGQGDLDNNKNQLGSNGGTPHDGTAGKVHANVEVRRDDDTESNQSTLSGHKTTAGLGWGQFADREGRSRCVKTVAPAADDTTDNDLGDTKRGSLQDGTNGHESSTDIETVATAETLADDEDVDGASKTTDSVEK